jgi:hypothetical protein
LNLRHYVKAIQDFEKALEIDPHPEAKNLLVKAKDMQAQIKSEIESARRGEFLMSSSKDIMEIQPSVDNLILSVFKGSINEETSHKNHKKKSKKKHSKRKDKKHKKRRKEEGYNSSTSHESFS